MVVFASQEVSVDDVPEVEVSQYLERVKAFLPLSIIYLGSGYGFFLVGKSPHIEAVPCSPGIIFS